MIVLNLTQHKPNPFMLNLGVQCLSEVDEKILKTLMSFDELPTHEEMQARAKRIAALAKDFFSDKEEEEKWCQVSAPVYFVEHMVKALKEEGLVPVYSFTRSNVVEKTIGNEITKKVFRKHIGWIMA